MKVSDVARGLTTRFRRLGGGHFNGSLLQPDTGTPTTAFNMPRRILRVGMKASVDVGTVFATADGRRFLMCAGSANDTARFQHRSFTCIEVPKTLAWTRKTTATDPVTGLEKDAGVASLGDVYAAMEGGREVVDGEIGVSVSTYRVVTGSAIQRGDFLDGKKVKHVYQELGVYVAEIQ